MSHPQNLLKNTQTAAPRAAGVAGPDLGYEFFHALTPEQQEGLLHSLTTSLPAGAEVLACRAVTSVRLGAWLRPAAGPGESLARAATLASCSWLAPGETFGAFVAAGFVQRTAQIAWFQTPQRR